MNLNFAAIFKTLCSVLVILGAAMLFPLLAALYYDENREALIFGCVAFPLMLAAGAVCLRLQPRQTVMRARDGLLTVALVWLAASLVGSIPYAFSGAVDGVIDAIFESTAAFTTTGASVLTDIETTPRSLLLWRSLVQWLGGMGILIFAISILPALGIGGQKMARAETPSPLTMDKLAPRMSDSAKILYLFYLAFTLVLFLLLRLGGVDRFDSLIVTFASVASGGIHIHSGGLAYYGSLYVEVLVTFFTILVCVNFTLYYKLVQGRIREFFSDRELLTFLSLLAAGGLLISANLFFTDTAAVGDSARMGFFHAVAAGTTTGHATADVTLWPLFSQALLVMLMLVGACGSSTGSGVKVVRFMVLFKLIQRGVTARLHPRAVFPIKLHGRPLPEETVTAMVSYLGLYFFVFAASVLILSLENLDVSTTLTAVIACLNNIGMGLGEIGPAGSFHVFSDFSKLYLCGLMIAGRLELFTIFMLFIPGFWDPDR